MMTKVPLVGADDLRKKEFFLHKNSVLSSDRISYRREETWEMTSRKQGKACRAGAAEGTGTFSARVIMKKLRHRIVQVFGIPQNCESVAAFADQCSNATCAR